MALDKVPIQHFVAKRYAHPAVQKIVESWRIEPAVLIDKLVEHMREMGIYDVPYGQEPLIMETLLQQLRNSPDILKMVAKMRYDELRRVRNRHAD